MRKILLVLFFGSFFPVLFAQSIQQRLILLGDAGEINFKQETIIPEAAEKIIPGKTTVLFLGDNIYPRGLALPGSDNEKETKDILRSQFEPMRRNGAPVYFLAGNHDWDRMGKLGLEKIQVQGRFLESQGDSLLKLIPEGGCPDPLEVVLSDSLVVIAYDSEWWLFPFNKQDANMDCACTTEDEVIDRLEELLYKHRDKTVVLASHHPLQTYGVHGGYYSWKDHIFPLTVLNKKAYVPLPLIGSLYPLLRSTIFLNPEDMPHPAYKNLISRVNDVTSGFSNLINVAGHDHGLQLIKNSAGRVQIVSGSGAKSSYIKKGEDALFTSKMQGFVLLDYMDDRSMKLTFFEYADKNVNDVFSYSVPYHSGTSAVDFNRKPIENDSVTIKANEAFDEVGKFHRRFFGENYRKEWAADTRLPVIRVSEFAGGLTPLKRGGGMQTTSLRLEDKTGKQWVLRSVNKNAEALIPAALRNTFAEGVLDDAVSAQHPYSALIVPPIAQAAGVPSANPIIGVVAPDSALGVHNLAFAHTLNLLEEREPLGDSDNTLKMLEKVFNDNDDTFGAKTFFRSRLLDLLVADWDRHEDQFRWVDETIEKDKDYRVVPRDRDQVIRLMDGFFPRLVAREWAIPANQGFSPDIPNVNYSLFKSDFLNAHPKMQLSYDEWMELSREFVSRVTDSVLSEGLKRLPKSSYDIRGEQLLADLKHRRDLIPEKMDEHFRFVNSIVDIRLSNKHERAILEDAPGGAIRVQVNKINKEGELKGVLMDKIYQPDITREIRLYLSDGNDSVQVDVVSSDIRLRLIGGNDSKHYSVENAKSKIRLYDHGRQSTLIDRSGKVMPLLSADSNHTAFVPVNLYNVLMPLVTAGFNVDDGITLGGGFKYTHQRGFRKTPFTHTQQVLLSASLSTGSFKFAYKGHWRHAIGKADFLLDASAFVPNNTQNFFGLGNNSIFDRDTRSASYYRARYNLYEVEPSLQWEMRESRLKVGPKFQFYGFNPSDNEGRFITESRLVNSYDSLIIDRDKAYAGLQFDYTRDNRNSTLLPSSGGYFNLNIQGLAGLNEYSSSFMQLTSEVAFFKGLSNNAVILANRAGGGFTKGNMAFYQALYLGGENLWGARRYRFAGEHMIYNNLEARIRLAEVGSYILPGQLGLLAFYDAGKVWAEGHNSSTIHQGYGGGLYYAPAQMLVAQLVAGRSEGHWFPYFTLGFRF